MGISMDKRAEKAQISLLKNMQISLKKGHDLGAVSAEVKLALDYSGSMENPGKRYSSGEVQDICERGIGVSLAGLDDDKKIQLYPFHHTALPMHVLSLDNYQGFIDRWRKNVEMGFTNYSPVMRKIVDDAHRTSELKPGKPPIFVIFVTDGEPEDKSEIIRLIVEYAKLPIFWQFVGLGYKPEFLSQLDTMQNRFIDNVGLLTEINGRKITDTKAISDEDFYDAIFKEFLTSWLPEAQKKGLVTRIAG